jgi:5-formyltetrahydrofolate cyclo-ligase
MENLMSNSFEESPLSSKRKLRHDLKQVRQLIPLERRSQASKDACEWLYQQSQYHVLILSFASFGSEINLWPLNKQLAQENRLVLPRLVDQEIQLYQVDNLDNLETHLWGMREPNPSTCLALDKTLISLALIPGLGFDPKTGHRLGYGRGYYDRLLPSLSHLETYGVGFKEQQVDHLIFEAQDSALKQVFLF